MRRFRLAAKEKRRVFLRKRICRYSGPHMASSAGRPPLLSEYDIHQALSADSVDTDTCSLLAEIKDEGIETALNPYPIQPPVENNYEGSRKRNTTMLNKRATRRMAVMKISYSQYPTPPDTHPNIYNHAKRGILPHANKLRKLSMVSNLLWF